MFHRVRKCRFLRISKIHVSIYPIATRGFSRTTRSTYGLSPSCSYSSWEYSSELARGSVSSTIRTCTVLPHAGFLFGTRFF
jgi:hypothetical protein